MPVKGARVVVRTTDTGDFQIEPVVQSVIMGGFAQVIYMISEDLLREAVGRANIKTGLLRSTGNVRLEDQEVVAMELSNAIKSGPTKSGKLRAGRVYVGKKENPTTVAIRAMQQAKTSSTFKFVVGFATPYARYIHQSDRWTKLGPRSLRANSGGKFKGRVGKYYLTRAWDDNQSRYFSFLDRTFRR